MRKIFFLLLLIFPTILFAQQNEITWDFPVKPGSEEWSNLKTRTERLNAMQIPTNILSGMGTEELVVACINYPAALQYGIYTNEFEGINKIIEGFNGLQELLSRKDGCKYLTKFYQNAEADGLIKKDERINERFWPLRFRYVELLISQDKIINSSEYKETVALLGVTINKTELKSENTYHFSSYDNIISSLIIAKILSKLRIEKFITNDEYMHFATNRELKSYDQVIEIIELGKKVFNDFIKSNTEK